MDIKKSIKKEKLETWKTKTPFPFGNCKICDDKATGTHYGVPTCEGCKVKLKFIKIYNRHSVLDIE